MWLIEVDSLGSGKGKGQADHITISFFFNLTFSFGVHTHIGPNSIHLSTFIYILSSQVISLPLQSVIQEVANFCATMDTLIDQDVLYMNTSGNIYIYIYIYIYN